MSGRLYTNRRRSVAFLGRLKLALAASLLHCYASHTDPEPGRMAFNRLLSPVKHRRNLGDITSRKEHRAQLRIFLQRPGAMRLPTFSFPLAFSLAIHFDRDYPLAF